MLTCEAVRPTVDIEPREPMKRIGSLQQTINLLYPQLSTDVQDQASGLLERIQDACSPTMEDALLILRGSGAKRLIYQSVTGRAEPPGWTTPQQIWSELLKDEPEEMHHPYSLHTFVHREPELDIVYQPKKGEDFVNMEDRISQVVVELQLPVHVGFFKYSNVSLANIQWPDDALTVQIHSFPEFHQWHEEARTSGYFIASEIFAPAFIYGREVFVKPEDINFYTHDKAMISFDNGVLEQVMIGFQRTRLNYIFFGSDRKNIVQPRKGIGGMFVDDEFVRERFWQKARNKSSLHSDHFQARQEEIMVNNMLLLTCCPHLLFEPCDRLYWNQFAIAQANIPESIFIEQDEYRRKFQDGSLLPEESGPVALMKHFGFSKPSELLPLVTPQL